MIRAIIDTNVFVSGTIWKGAPHQVLSLWSDGRFKLVVSHEIVTEYEAVLNNLLNHQPELVSQILETIRIHAEFVQPVKLQKPVCRDPNDDMFIAAALGARVDFIVSGDKDLIILDGVMGLRIVKPRGFLDSI